jgi:hypothetical protein
LHRVGLDSSGIDPINVAIRLFFAHSVRPALCTTALAMVESPEGST